jgi:hypothetical protein
MFCFGDLVWGLRSIAAKFGLGALVARSLLFCEHVDLVYTVYARLKSVERLVAVLADLGDAELSPELPLSLLDHLGVEQPTSVRVKGPLSNAL